MNTHTLRQTHTEINKDEHKVLKMWAQAHADTRTQQPLRFLSLMLVKQYFSIAASGSPAYILLYTVSALSHRI